MARNLFIAQATLATWTEQEKITFDQNVMTIKADGRSFRLVEAVRFVALEGGGEDKPGLLGRVKTDMQLRKMGAERCRDSVIYQDLAYKVQEGFLAEVLLNSADTSQPEIPVIRPAPAPAKPAGAPSPQPDRPAVRTPLEASLAGIGKEGQAKPGEENKDVELLTKFLLENL